MCGYLYSIFSLLVGLGVGFGVLFVSLGVGFGVFGILILEEAIKTKAASPIYVVMDQKYTLILRNGFLYAQCHLHARKTGRVEINCLALYTSVFEFANMHWKVFYERIS